MPTPSDKTKLKRLLAKAAAYGVTDVELPSGIETESDKVSEAQAVLDYVESRGKSWNHKDCKNCGKPFVYRWNRDNISCCSTMCMAEQLEKIGIKWDPRRSPKQRWGPHIPEVVSAPALELIESYDILSALTDGLQDT